MSCWRIARSQFHGDFDLDYHEKDMFRSIWMGAPAVVLSAQPEIDKFASMDDAGRGEILLSAVISMCPATETPASAAAPQQTAMKAE